jgi:hypothetical protein
LDFFSKVRSDVRQLAMQTSHSDISGINSTQSKVVVQKTPTLFKSPTAWSWASRD